jgi:hypothetical protein
MGRDGSSEPAASWFDGSPDDLFESQPMVADAAKPRPRATARRKLATPVRHVEPTLVPEEPKPKADVPKHVAPVEYALADSSARDRYAERENSAQQQQQFMGGSHVVIIGVSTLVVVLLVVLLILLLL